MAGCISVTTARQEQAPDRRLWQTAASRAAAARAPKGRRVQEGKRGSGTQGMVSPRRTAQHPRGHGWAGLADRRGPVSVMVKHRRGHVRDGDPSGGGVMRPPIARPKQHENPRSEAAAPLEAAATTGPRHRTHASAAATRTQPQHGKPTARRPRTAAPTMKDPRATNEGSRENQADRAKATRERNHVAG